jgi:hypothetical protein
MAYADYAEPTKSPKTPEPHRCPGQNKRIMTTLMAEDHIVWSRHIRLQCNGEARCLAHASAGYRVLCFNTFCNAHEEKPMLAGRERESSAAAATVHSMYIQPTMKTPRSSSRPVPTTQLACTAKIAPTTRHEHQSKNPPLVVKWRTRHAQTCCASVAP